jgi:hypothetical protein
MRIQTQTHLENVVVATIGVWTVTMTAIFADGGIFAYKILAWILLVLAVLTLCGMLWFIVGRKPEYEKMSRNPDSKAKTFLLPNMSPGYIWALRNKSTDVNLVYDLFWLAVSGFMGMRMRVRKPTDAPKNKDDPLDKVEYVISRFALFQKKDVDLFSTKNRGFQNQLHNKLFSHDKEITWSIYRKPKLLSVHGWLRGYYREIITKDEIWTQNTRICGTAWLPVLVFCEWLTQVVCNTSFMVTVIAEILCIVAIAVFISSAYSIKNSVKEEPYSTATGKILRNILGPVGLVFSIWLGLFSFSLPTFTHADQDHFADSFIPLLEFDFVLFLGSLAILAIIALFSFRLIKPVYKENAGRQLDEIEHLAEYLRTAKPESPEDAPRMFEALLPFAMALGVEKKWIQGFQPILEQMNYTPTFLSLEESSPELSLEKIIEHAKDEISGAQNRSFLPTGAFSAATIAFRLFITNNGGGRSSK